MSLFQNSLGSVCDGLKSLLLREAKTELIEEETLPLTRLPPLLQSAQLVRKIDLHLLVDKEFSLDTFGDLRALASLTLRVERSKKLYVRDLHGIIAPNKAPFSSLTFLCIKDANLFGEFCKGISALALEELSLEGCHFVGVCRLHALAACKALRKFTTKNLFKHPCHSIIQGGLHELKRRSPHLEITNQEHINDYRDFAELFSNHPICTNLPLDQVKTLTPLPDLSALFSLGNEQHAYWELEPSCETSYMHNLAPLKSASVIDLGDGRIRFAAREPVTDEEKAAFWHFVDQEDISLIVKVKTDDFPPYFPFCDDTLSVEPYSMIYDKTIDRTRREFKVNEKIIHHLQLDWTANQGIEIERLYPFLEEVEALEKKFGGKTIIHCTAGVGRTGTTLACMLAKHKLKSLEKKDGLYFNPIVAFLGLRQMRPWMIETPAQLNTFVRYVQKLLT